MRPNKPEAVRLDRGRVLLVWKPVQSNDPFTYCVQYCTNGEFTGCRLEVRTKLLSLSLNSEMWCLFAGGVWTVLADDVTDSCYTVKDLPRGASYVFRVGCVSKAGAGAFSEASVPIVMSTHPEGVLIFSTILFHK